MSDTTPRDQLVEDLLGILCNAANFPRSAVGMLGQDMRPLAGKVADRILAAGWRPPARVVTTVEEVEELADMTVVLESGRDWCFVSRKLGNNYWLADGIEDAFPSVDIGLPATVLWEPEEDE